MLYKREVNILTGKIIRYHSLPTIIKFNSSLSLYLMAPRLPSRAHSFLSPKTRGGSGKISFSHSFSFIPRARRVVGRILYTCFPFFIPHLFLSRDPGVGGSFSGPLECHGLLREFNVKWFQYPRSNRPILHYSIWLFQNTVSRTARINPTILSFNQCYGATRKSSTDIAIYFPRLDIKLAINLGFDMLFSSTTNRR